MSGTGPGSSDTNYVPLVSYNGTVATGGDSLHDNLNIYYEVRWKFWSHVVCERTDRVVERRYRLDLGIHCTGPTHDPRRGVSLNHLVGLRNYTYQYSASSTLVWPDASRLSH